MRRRISGASEGRGHLKPRLIRLLGTVELYKRVWQRRRPRQQQHQIKTTSGPSFFTRAPKLSDKLKKCFCLFVSENCGEASKPLESNFLKNISEVIVDYLFLFFLLLFSTKIRKIIIFHLKGQSIATEQTPWNLEVVGLTPARLFSFILPLLSVPPGVASVRTYKAKVI